MHIDPTREGCDGLRRASYLMYYPLQAHHLESTSAHAALEASLTPRVCSGSA